MVNIIIMDSIFSTGNIDVSNENTYIKAIGPRVVSLEEVFGDWYMDFLQGIIDEA